jgi:hypothetical protein
VVRGSATGGPYSGGGGVFVWSTPYAADDGATMISLTGWGGCWKRLYSGALDVRWFGAKGDGATNDLPAFDAATTRALETGADLRVPHGYYRVTGTWNIGPPEFDSYDFIVSRTEPMSDAALNAHTINWNYCKQGVVIRFEAGAFIVADFTPATPTPVVSYNFKGGSTPSGGMYRVAVIGTGSFVGGKYVAPPENTPAPMNKLIGIYAAANAKVIEAPFLSGLQYGLVTSRCFGRTAGSSTTARTARSEGSIRSRSVRISPSSQPRARPSARATWKTSLKRTDRASTT